MKHSLTAFATWAIMMSCAMAQNVGVSMAFFDDLFLTNLREAIAAKAKEAGVNVQFEDAQGDIGKQLSQIQNFIAKKVDAIVVNPVDSSATAQMTRLIKEAGIPLVYVNIPPIEKLKPDEPVVYVGSDEIISGNLEGEGIAKLLNGKGNVVILMGAPASQASVMRTEGAEKVFAQHPGIKVTLIPGCWARTFSAPSVRHNGGLARRGAHQDDDIFLSRCAAWQSLRPRGCPK